MEPTGNATPDASHSGNGPTSSRGRGHKGRGAQRRRQEGFRYSKNVETVRNHRDAIFAKFSLPQDSVFNSLPSQARSFIQPRIPTAVQKPARFIPIRTDGVRELFQPIRDNLRVMKIEILDEEFRALVYVTARQISAKIFFSQIGYGDCNSWQLAKYDFHRQTAAMLSECLRPLAIFIESIGRFTLHGQVNVPTLRYCASEDFPTHDSTLGRWIFQHIVENYECQQHDWIAELGVVEHLVDPLLMSDQGGSLILPFYEHSDMILHYKSLISKVVRRYSNSVVMLDIEKGLGTSIQLVGSVAEGIERRCGCVYPLDQPELTMGAMFGFGLYSHSGDPPSPLHTLEHSCVQANVPCVGWSREFSLGLFGT